MKKNTVVSLISIALCALIGIAAYQTVQLVAGLVSGAYADCDANSTAECSRQAPNDRFQP